MPEPIVVRVENRHIQDGIRTSSTACPIGLALNEQYGHIGQWYIKTIPGLCRACVFPGRSYPLPLKVIRFSLDHDKGLLVSPITFTLSPDTSEVLYVEDEI